MDDGGKPVDYYEMQKMDVSLGHWTSGGTSNSCQGEVKGLIEGKSYLFRVLAVNTYGESEPAVTNQPILAKNASDPPGQPGPVSLVNWGQSFCTLKWAPPADNGGSAITSYIVEVLEKGFHDWREALTTLGNEVEGTIKPPTVMEFREYRFRVVAFNEMGPSEPSHPTEFVQMKERFVKPKIEKSASRIRGLFQHI